MNNGIDFGTVANNASVHHQFIDFIFIIKGDFIWVKIIKHLIKPLSLSQMVIQLKPACILSRHKRAKSVLSSSMILPHSVS